MLLQQTTEVIGNSVRLHTTYIREHWHEWLWLTVSEGEAVPHFYLPVYRDYNRYSTTCWITPLAPFVLITMASYYAFRSFWMDCVWTVNKWRDIKRPPERITDNT